MKAMITLTIALTVMLMITAVNNMVMGIPTTMENGDYDNNQSVIEISDKTERFYYKFYDIWNECNGDRFEAIYDMCVTLFTDFNKRMDGYFTNHTEEVETVLYR